MMVPIVLAALLSSPLHGQSGEESRTFPFDRSEEHTSELQSPCNLVCRLLLEKKKQRRALAVVCRRACGRASPSARHASPRGCPYDAVSTTISIDDTSELRLCTNSACSQGAA